MFHKWNKLAELLWNRQLDVPQSSSENSVSKKGLSRQIREGHYTTMTTTLGYKAFKMVDKISQANKPNKKLSVQSHSALLFRKNCTLCIIQTSPH